MSLAAFAAQYLPNIEAELQSVVADAGGPGLDAMHSMLAYHLGWKGEGAAPEARGKRIRPLLLLLTCQAAGGNWQNALPAAAAVELLHNFSLIHDDIEDSSPLRHGRETVWKKWGLPQAINSGDAMFTLAYLSLANLEDTCSPDVTIQAQRLLLETCLKLTQGQFLDISYEERQDLGVDDYYPMITGKTAALLSACTGLGALVAGAQQEIQETYQEFGLSLGLAFQVQDDILGIWGDAELTGKSADSDLVSGKKSLPVLYGLSRDGAFARRWKAGKIHVDEVPFLAQQLKSEGAYEYTQKMASMLTKNALNALEAAYPKGEAGEALRELANQLLDRKI